VNVTVTGATGLIGTAIVRALQGRGDAVTVLTRDPDRARGALGDVEAHAWRALEEPAPAAALSGRDAVVHLAGENVAQRWNDETRRAIRATREVGTRNLVAGLAAADPRPRTLVSASGIDYYGARGDDEPVTEDAAPGEDFLAQVCVAWEREAAAAGEHGVRVAMLRTAVVLDRHGGALSKMLPFFRLGIGGPVAGGRQYMPWIHAEDIVGLYLAAVDGDWQGPFNACAPDPVTNREFSRALGRALRRPAIAPVPGLAVRVLYGDMAEIVTTGQRAVPMRALEHGYAFRHTDLGAALRDAVG
jgi:uncharacterized protein (TIGR01777 family)